MALWETPKHIELSEGDTLSLYCIKVFMCYEQYHENSNSRKTLYIAISERVNR